MGNGAKITLVALLIIMVVVVAKFVQNGSKEKDPAAKSGAVLTGGKPAGKGGEDPALLIGQKSIGQKGIAPKKGDAAAASQGVITNRPRPLGSSLPGTPGAEAKILPPAGETGNPGATPATPGVTLSPESPPPSPPAPGGTAPAGGDSNLVRLEANPPSPPVRDGERSTLPFTPVPTPGADGSPGRTSLNPGREFSGSTSELQPTPESRPGAGDVQSPLSPFVVPIDRPSEKSLSITDSAQPDAGGFPRKHLAVSGESYWALAEKYYGKGKGPLCKIIQDANGGKMLIAGQTVTIPEPPPSPPAAEARSPGSVGSVGSEPPPRGPASAAPAPADTSDDRFIYHVVRENETPSGIARRIYGNPAAVDRIYEANPNLKYVTMRAGQKIRLPKP